MLRLAGKLHFNKKQKKIYHELFVIFPFENWRFLCFGRILGNLRSINPANKVHTRKCFGKGCQFASLFSIAALLKLVFSLFFRLMSPLSNDETGRGCSPVYSCGVVIMDLLVDRCCFSFSIDSLWFPTRRCDISGTLVVPLVVFVENVLIIFF